MRLTISALVHYACFLLAAALATAGSVSWEEAIQTSEWLQASGKLDDAEQVIAEALARVPPSSHGRLAYLYNNLGSIRHDQTRYAEAESYYRRSITEWEKAGDSDLMALSLARTINNLAALRWETGRLGEVEGLLIKSEAIRVGILGSRDLATTLNLARLYLRQRRWGEAEVGYRQALTMADSDGHHSIEAAAANYLGAICRRTGRYSEADVLFRSADRWRRHGEGEPEPELLQDLAVSFCYANRHTEAEPVLKQALAVIESRFGPNHPRSRQALSAYATVLRKIHRGAEARKVEKQAKGISSDEAELRLARQEVAVADLADRKRKPK